MKLFYKSFKTNKEYKYKKYKYECIFIDLFIDSHFSFTLF